MDIELQWQEGCPNEPGKYIFRFWKESEEDFKDLGREQARLYRIMQQREPVAWHYHIVELLEENDPSPCLVYIRNGIKYTARLDALEYKINVWWAKLP